MRVTQPTLTLALAQIRLGETLLLLLLFKLKLENVLIQCYIRGRMTNDMEQDRQDTPRRAAF